MVTLGHAEFDANKLIKPSFNLLIRKGIYLPRYHNYSKDEIKNMKIIANTKIDLEYYYAMDDDTYNINVVKYEYAEHLNHTLHTVVDSTTFILQCLCIFVVYCDNLSINCLIRYRIIVKNIYNHVFCRHNTKDSYAMRLMTLYLAIMFALDAKLLTYAIYKWLNTKQTMANTILVTDIKIHSRTNYQNYEKMDINCGNKLNTLTKIQIYFGQKINCN